MGYLAILSTTMNEMSTKPNTQWAKNKSLNYDRWDINKLLGSSRTVL